MVVSITSKSYLQFFFIVDKSYLRFLVHISRVFSKYNWLNIVIYHWHKTESKIICTHSSWNVNNKPLILSSFEVTFPADAPPDYVSACVCEKNPFVVAERPSYTQHLACSRMLSVVFYSTSLRPYLASNYRRTVHTVHRPGKLFFYYYYGNRTARLLHRHSFWLKEIVSHSSYHHHNVNEQPSLNYWPTI